MVAGLKKNVIKKVSVSLCILVVSIWGCSGMNVVKDSVHPTLEKRKEQILDWATAEKARVDEGTLKRSEYWKEFYLKAIELRPDLDDFLYFALEMIKVSRIYEEGKITEKQFDDKYRQLTTLLAQEENRRSTAYENYETWLFISYRSSLLVKYMKDLRQQLSAAGPQFSDTQCAFFDDSIKCTAQKPLF